MLITASVDLVPKLELVVGCICHISRINNTTSQTLCGHLIPTCRLVSGSGSSLCGSPEDSCWQLALCPADRLDQYPTSLVQAAWLALLWDLTSCMS